MSTLDILGDVIVLGDARNWWNHTGIFVTAGERYCTSVCLDAKWYDSKIIAGARGIYTLVSVAFSDILARYEKTKRTCAIVHLNRYDR